MIGQDIESKKKVYSQPGRVSTLEFPATLDFSQDTEIEKINNCL